MVGMPCSDKGVPEIFRQTFETCSDMRRHVRSAIGYSFTHRSYGCQYALTCWFDRSIYFNISQSRLAAIAGIPKIGGSRLRRRILSQQSLTVGREAKAGTIEGSILIGAGNVSSGRANSTGACGRTAESWDRRYYHSGCRSDRDRRSRASRICAGMHSGGNTRGASA